MEGLIATLMENTDPCSQLPGPVHLLLEPVFPRGMVFSREEVHIAGRTVLSRWLRHQGKCVMRLSIPMATHCALKLPDGQLLPLGPGEHRIEYPLK